MSDSRYRIIKAERICSPAEGCTGQRYLLIRNGIIEAVAHGMPPQHGAEILDFTGFSVSPFLCDYHLHFSGTASAISEDIARVLLQSGIRRVFEGGDRDLTGVKMQGLFRNKVEVRTSGYALYKKGTYGKHIGQGVEGPVDARELIDHLCNCGVDYIKIINSGIFRPETGEISPGGFEQGELTEIISYIKGRGMECFCHANGEENIRHAVLAGVSGIIHGFYISDESLDIMAEHKIAFIPTINAFAGLSQTIKSSAQRILERAVGAHLIMVKKAREKGVKVLPGSDSGPRLIPYGRAFHRELQLFKRAGMSTGDIISSACVDALTSGIRADFLVLDGLKIKQVFLSGECFSGEGQPIDEL